MDAVSNRPLLSSVPARGDAGRAVEGRSSGAPHAAGLTPASARHLSPHVADSSSHTDALRHPSRRSRLDAVILLGAINKPEFLPSFLRKIHSLSSEAFSIGVVGSGDQRLDRAEVVETLTGRIDPKTEVHYISHGMGIRTEQVKGTHFTVEGLAQFDVAQLVSDLYLGSVNSDSLSKIEPLNFYLHSCQSGLASLRPIPGLRVISCSDTKSTQLVQNIQRDVLNLVGSQAQGRSLAVRHAHLYLLSAHTLSIGQEGAPRFKVSPPKTKEQIARYAEHIKEDVLKIVNRLGGREQDLEQVHSLSQRIDSRQGDMAHKSASLLLALSKKKRERVVDLLNAGAKAALMIEGLFGVIPLMYAIKFGLKEEVRILASHESSTHQALSRILQRLQLAEEGKGEGVDEEMIAIIRKAWQQKSLLSLVEQNNREALLTALGSSPVEFDDLCLLLEKAQASSKHAAAYCLKEALQTFSKGQIHRLADRRAFSELKAFVDDPRVPLNALNDCWFTFSGGSSESESEPALLLDGAIKRRQ